MDGHRDMFFSHHHRYQRKLRMSAFCPQCCLHFILALVGFRLHFRQIPLNEDAKPKMLSCSKPVGTVQRHAAVQATGQMNPERRDKTPEAGNDSLLGPTGYLGREAEALWHRS